MSSFLSIIYMRKRKTNCVIGLKGTQGMDKKTAYKWTFILNEPVLKSISNKRVHFLHYFSKLT